VAVILRLGGIYVKIGQFASTMGNGILQDAYVAALRPLQDGVPPRPLSEVSAIIEASVGIPMAELFESFDELPVGAASIAQAHRARLAGSGEVHMNSHTYV
jgi:predicted unusual protein kinase regulating ubiquinone biosynthesis (AarF/ABC1/UbiB family)